MSFGMMAAVGVVGGLVAIGLVFLGYWVGRRSQRTSLKTTEQTKRRASDPAERRTPVPFAPHMLEIVEVDHELALGAEMTPIGAEASRTLASAISATAPIQPGHTYRLKFSPEVLRKLRSGEVDFVRSQGDRAAIRAIVKGPKGQIVEHAELVPASRMRVLGVASFQVVSFVVGQAHLQGIEQRLAAIEDKLADLVAFGIEAQEGAIQGNIEYMREIARVVLSGQLEPSETSIYLHQIEDIEREYLKLSKSLELESKRLLEKIIDLDLDKALNSIETDKKNLMQLVQQYRVLGRRLEGLLLGRACCVQMMLALPCPRQLVAARVDSVRQQCNQWTETLGMLKKTIHRRAKELRGAFTLAETEQKYRREVRDSATKTFKSWTLHSQETMSTLDKVLRRGDRFLQQLESGEGEFLMRVDPRLDQPQIVLVSPEPKVHQS